MLAAESRNQGGEEEALHRREIVWTLFMMDRVYVGHNISGPSTPASSYDLFVFGKGPPVPGDTCKLNAYVTLKDSLDVRLNSRSTSVVIINIELLLIWESVVMDIFEARSGRVVPFWNDGSPRSKIQTSLLEFELSECSSPRSRCPGF